MEGVDSSTNIINISISAIITTYTYTHEYY